jgi:hypothetical protein
VFAIGGSLREARERQGLELTEAEAATKIRAKYLRALEEERFDLLPAQTYVKGFLRSYADSLGLDGQLYVDEFNSRFASGDDDLPTVTRPRRPRPASGRQVETTVVLVALAGIAAVTALVIVAWKWGGSPSERPALVRPPAPSATRESRGKSSGPEWIRLTVRAARGNSWLQVRRGSRHGRRLWGRVLQRGEERSFVGPRLYLLVAEPQNLDVRLAGKRVSLPGGRHRLKATPRGVKPVG